MLEHARLIHKADDGYFEIMIPLKKILRGQGERPTDASAGHTLHSEQFHKVDDLSGRPGDFGRYRCPSHIQAVLTVVRKRVRQILPVIRRKVEECIIRSL
jgi:hypothetical protein